GIYAGAIDSEVVAVTAVAGVAGVPDNGGADGATAKAAYIVGVGAAKMMVPAVVIDHRRIVDDGGPVDDRDVVGLPDIIVVDLRAADILVRNKPPVVGRWGIAAADRYAIADIGTQGGPAVIFIAIAPFHPGGGPFVAGHPHPTVAVLKEPAAVVE